MTLSELTALVQAEVSKPLVANTLGRLLAYHLPRDRVGAGNHREYGLGDLRAARFLLRAQKVMGQIPRPLAASGMEVAHKTEGAGWIALINGEQAIWIEGFPSLDATLLLTLGAVVVLVPLEE